jgi:hypothetical protein
LADKTSNYNLIKPEENETADISVINNNFDIIDTKIKENNDHINNAKEDIGNTSNLNTKEKSSLVGAVNEVSASMADIAYKTVGGTANAITISKQGFTLTDGQYVEFKATANNTGNMTIKVNDEAVKSLRNEDGEQLSSNEIEANKYYRFIYDGNNDFFVQRPNGLAKKKEHVYQRKIANLSAVADIYDDRTVGATGVWYDLLDGTNDYSRGKIDTTKTSLAEAISIGETDLTNKVVSTNGFKDGQEITIQDDVNKERVIVNLEKTISSVQEVDLNATQPNFNGVYDVNYCSAKDNYGVLYVLYRSIYDLKLSCYRSEDDGKTWTYIGIDTNSNVTRQEEPTMLVDKNNNIHVFSFGRNSNSSKNQINHIIYDGQNWSAWNEVTTNSDYNNSYPHAVCDSNNIIHLIWEGEDDKHPKAFQIRYAKLENNKWSTPISLTDETKSQQHPKIVIDSNDHLHVVWDGADTSNSAYQIKYSKYDGSTWSNWVNISVISGYNQFFADISLDSNNNPHVVWGGGDSVYTTKKQIKYIEYNGTSWGSYENLTDDNVYSSQHPEVKIDQNNDVHVIWRQADAQTL